MEISYNNFRVIGEAYPGCDVKTVKKLKDICLQQIGDHLNSINGVGRYLPPAHKELLLQRLIDHDRLNPEFLPFITYNLFSRSLRNLELCYSEQVTDGVLQQLAGAGSKLHTLSIKNCRHVGDQGLLSITLHQNELVCLTLYKLAVTSAGLTNIASPCLKRLSIERCSKVTAEGVKCVVNKNPCLEWLDLTGCMNIDNSVFLVIANTLRGQLRELFLDQIHIVNDESLVALAENCPNLRRLCMSSSNRISEHGMKKLIEHCTLLQSLDVSYCPMLVKPPGSEVLLSLPCTLKHLSLCGVLLEDQQLFVKAIVNLPALTVIRLCGVPALCDDTLHEILCVIGWRLEQLDLSGGINSVTDHGLKSVAKLCSNLKVLVLNLLRGITGTTLLPLFHNPETAQRFATLYLKCTGVLAEVLYSIASNCINLRVLDLAGLAVVDDDLMCMVAANCPHLTEVNLKGCRKVTDRSLCELACCCPLSHLVLSGVHSITDKSIFALANNCPYLEEMFLDGCQFISPCAIYYLQDCCIPRVRIYHRIPNLVSGQLMAKNLDTGEFCRADQMLVS